MIKIRILLLRCRKFFNNIMIYDLVKNLEILKKKDIVIENKLRLLGYDYVGNFLKKLNIELTYDLREKFLKEVEKISYGKSRRQRKKVLIDYKYDITKHDDLVSCMNCNFGKKD